MAKLTSTQIFEVDVEYYGTLEAWAKITVEGEQEPEITNVELVECFHIDEYGTQFDAPSHVRNLVYIALEEQIERDGWDVLNAVINDSNAVTV